MAEGEADPLQLAAMAEPEVRATPEQLCDALRAAFSIHPTHRYLLKQYLERIHLNDRHIEELDQQLAACLKEHEAAVVRLSHVPGLGVDSAQQIVAEIGPTAAVFPSAAQLCSWVGTCPGREESAEESKSNRSPKCNRSLRRILDQAANAAVKTKGSLFQALYRRIRGRDQKKHNLAIWAVANRLCRIVWKVLHQGVPYEERASQPNRKAIKDRARRLVRELRRLGYNVNATSSEAEGVA